MTNLQDFEGLPVVRTSIALTNAGDGLSESMKVAPAEFHVGDEAILVIRGACTKVTFRPIDKDDPTGDQERVHTFKAGTATLGDPDQLSGQLNMQAEKNLRAREEEAGINRLPMEEETPLTIRVRTWLSSLKKAELVELCAQYSIDVSPAARAADIIDTLAANADKIKASLEGEDG